MRPRALILAPFSAAALARLGTAVDVTHESWLETRRLHDPEALGVRLAAEDVSILIVEADFVFEEVFDAAPCLRLVGVCRNATNQVDIAAATAHGVAVTHAPGRNTNAVAEMTVAVMLALARRIPQAHGLVSGGGWSDPALGYRLFRGREVAGATVGVVGFGQIGRAVTAKCIALGARVLVADPLVPDRDVTALGGEPAGMPELAASDFVTLHVPDLQEPRALIDAAFLALMQPSAFLINTGAGGAVDHKALVAALTEGRIAGAALDVFPGQPLPVSSPLLSAPNLLLTPHIAGATAETVERHSLTMTEETERFLAGESLHHLVNPHYALTRAR